jgi:hypothetical protein
MTGERFLTISSIWSATSSSSASVPTTAHAASVTTAMTALK